MNTHIRLHLPAIPYTLTRDEYSHDAYTGKVKRFSPMMRSRGFEVYYYGVETSESGANKDIQLMTKDEWTELRIKTIQWLDPKLTLEEASAKNTDPTFVVSNLSNWSSPLTKEFNRRLRTKLQENYRSNKTDIMCLALGRTFQDALDGLNSVNVETGIGYSGSYLNFRIFESYAWLSKTLGVENKEPNNYHFVIPNYFDTNEFKLSLNPSPLKVGFLGRLIANKGCQIIVEIALRFPNLQFVLCGNGNPEPFLKAPNIVYKPPIHGEERSEYLGSCVAVLCLTKYLEPFCGVAVEAQLCGTPVISTDWGGMVETIEQFKTGLRGHTLADYCYGVQMALDGKFDRSYIRERSAKLYDMYNLAHNYEYVFKSVLDICNGNNGWYSPNTHIGTLLGDNTPNSHISEIPQPKIYKFIVYYGSFPNYFQLYLDSLAINNDILTVFLVTDFDLSSYNLPENLIHIKIDINNVKTRISDFLFKTYNKRINPEDLVKNNYKFVDFKIVYPLLFDDYLQIHKVKPTDYVGWGDCDLIYGKLSNFIKFNETFEIIGGWHGHFCAIKNTDSFKNNFKSIPNYFELVTNNSKTFITDEIAYREPLKQYLKDNNFKMFYTNRYFCDVVPECFYYKSRPEYKSYPKNFYHIYEPKKNLSHLYFDRSNSKLIMTYDDDESREVLYCHLQKRKMELSFTNYDKGYYINEDSFLENKELQYKKFTIITYCSGYKYEVFERFTGTLYDTGFTGNLIFAINESDLPNLEKLIKKYNKVSYFIDNIVNNRQCQQKRYYIFQNIIKTLETDYILLCDSRDIFFQKNIELYNMDKNIDIFFAEEDNIIANCGYNQKWLKMIETNINMEFIEKIKEKSIICSGTIFGTTRGISIFLDIMCDTMTNSITVDYPGLDQGILNYLIYNQNLNQLNYKILSNKYSEFINTLQYGARQVNNYNQFINFNKDISYIVHQWDRLGPLLRSRLIDRYSSSGYNFDLL